MSAQQDEKPEGYLTASEIYGAAAELRERLIAAQREWVQARGPITRGGYLERFALYVALRSLSDAVDVVRDGTVTDVGALDLLQRLIARMPARLCSPEEAGVSDGVAFTGGPGLKA